eukprot:5819617-Heterocapsa_arctica.AAC.1
MYLNIHWPCSARARIRAERRGCATSAEAGSSSRAYVCFCPNGSAVGAGRAAWSRPEAPRVFFAM